MLAEIKPFLSLPFPISRTQSSLTISLSDIQGLESLLNGSTHSFSSQTTEAVNDRKVIEVYSHPIMNAMNRILIHSLLGKSIDTISDLHEYVIESFTEKESRHDFIRILYQPSSFLSPYHHISINTAISLQFLFKAFFS